MAGPEVGDDALFIGRAVDDGEEGAVFGLQAEFIPPSADETQHGQHVRVRRGEARRPYGEGVVLVAQLGELAVPVHQRALADGEGRAVKGVEHAVHARLVAVIDAGHAGDGELYGSRQALHGAAALVLRVRDDKAGLLFARHAAGVQPGGEGGARAVHVVRGDQVHQRKIERRGVIQPLAEQKIGQGAGVRAEGEEVQHGAAEGVVHHRVQRLAKGVFAPRAIAGLGHGVLPHLAEDDGLRVGVLGRAADEGQGLVRQFVGHVQPPAGSAPAQPGAHDAVLAGDDEFAPARVVLVHLGQVGEVPPAAVFARPFAEVVPGVIGRSFAGVIGARAVVAGEAVEIHAVRARVRKNAVQHHPDAAFGGAFAQPLEVLVGAEHGVHLQVVARAVAVVAARFENGVEVDDAHAEGLQVGQAALDAAQRAAVEVQREVKAVRAVGLPVHGFVPALVVLHLPPARAVVFNAALGGVRGVAREAVGEDLVHDAAAEPRGRLKGGVVHRQAEGGAAGALQLAEAPAAGSAEPELALFQAQAEAVPERGGLRGGHQVAVPAPAGERHLVAALEAVAVQHELGVQHGGGAVAEAQAHALPGADGADGPPVALAGCVVGDVGLK